MCILKFCAHFLYFCLVSYFRHKNRSTNEKINFLLFIFSKGVLYIYKNWLIEMKNISFHSVCFLVDTSLGNVKLHRNYPRIKLTLLRVSIFKQLGWRNGDGWFDYPLYVPWGAFYTAGFSPLLFFSRNRIYMVLYSLGLI